MFWVGILLLVSAGSFIYVATLHILPEVYFDKENSSDHHHHGPVGKEDEPKHFSKCVELMTIIIGFFVPFVLMMLHHDE